MASRPGEPGPARWRRLRWARRISQGVFLVLFLWLIGITAALTGASYDASSSQEVGYPVEAFLDIDPLAGAIVLLSTGTIPGMMILGLVVLASALLLGRAFCSWACPMGTMNHLVGTIASSLKGKRLLEANRTRPYQKVKYALLAAVLAAAVLGSSVGSLLDPLSLATRGVALTFLPWIQWLLGGVLQDAFSSGVPAVQRTADGIYDAAASWLPHSRGFIASGGVLVTLLFLAVLVANRIIPRFWCRGLCPLGALLGLSGRAGVLTLVKNPAACTGCDKCQLTCSGAASPHPEKRWQRAECDLCFNCVAECPDNALAFRTSGFRTDEQPWPDLKRRSVVAGTAAGAALVPILRTGSIASVQGRPDPACIRPPGALDEVDFLSRCIRCGQCMKICPQNALHPALDEAGIEGLWTPVLIPKIGYCEPSCTLCTQVCPTGAIRRVSEQGKLGKKGEEMVRIGTAFFDRGRCLPWAMGTPCMVCEEFCPVSPKAIWTKEEVVYVHDTQVTVKRPYLDPTLCNGCGACEFICPIHDKAAIRITAAGESRSPGHEMLLVRPKKKN